MVNGQRNLHLHVTTRIRLGSDTVFVETLQPVDAWHAGLTPKEERRESVVSRRRFEQLRSLIESHKKWNAWRKRGESEFAWMRHRAYQEGHQWRFLLFNKGPTPELQRRAAWQFNAILDVIFGRAYPLIKDERLTPIRPVCPFIGPRASSLRRFARSVLKALGEPLDEWHQAAALSILLCPHLATILIAPGFWLARPGPNQTDLERQHAAFVGAPTSTERAGVKAKRDLRRRLGFQAPRVTPGPSRGAKYTFSGERRAFTTYVLARKRKGLIAKQIVLDREAQRLYQAAHKNDSTRDLSESVVRYALRQAEREDRARPRQI